MKQNCVFTVLYIFLSKFAGGHSLKHFRSWFSAQETGDVLACIKKLVQVHTLKDTFALIILSTIERLSILGGWCIGKCPLYRGVSFIQRCVSVLYQRFHCT